MKIKKPPFVNIFKLFTANLKNSVDMFECLMLQNKAVMRLYKPGLYLVNDPDAAQRILQSPDGIYVKEGKYINRLRIPFGFGLVTSEGHIWQSQRNLIQPYFFPKYLRRYADIVVNRTIQHLDTVWAKHAESEQKFNIASDLMQQVLLASGQILYSTDFTEYSKLFLKCVDFGQKYILGYYFVSPSLPSPVRWHYQQQDKKVKQIFTDMVNHRRQMQDKPDDILTALVTAVDPETNQPLPLNLIMAQIMTLLVTGHETTGSLLGWLWYELGTHPEIYQKLVNEIDTVLQGKKPSIDDLVKLPYLRMVVDEALRLYPTIWTVNRYVVKDDILAGYKIPKKSIVFVNPITLHHDPTLWPDPLEFEPQRFDRKCPVKHHKMAYIPFGGGNRICIGKNLAYLQIQLMLVLILQRFDVKLAKNKKPKALPLVSLKLNSPVSVTVTQRERLSHPQQQCQTEADALS